MTDANAPFHAEITKGPEGGRALWKLAPDGVRLRIGMWPAANAKGTVLLYPGRTEYIEKYGHIAAGLVNAGYGVVAIDWRGQGLSDRVMDDPYRGHVGDFADYQLDARVLLDTAKQEGFGGPYMLLGHSMGGCIGLRSLMDGLDVERAVFSAPMWGIMLNPAMRSVAWITSRVAHILGAGEMLAPGTQARSFILSDPFDDNTLTRDRDMWDQMCAQLRAVPGLELGGPSLDWVRLAISECAALAKMPSPDVPCLTFLGTHERIVDAPAIHDRMARWPGGRLDMIEGGEHEVMMDLPQTREHFLAAVTDFLSGGSA